MQRKFSSLSMAMPPYKADPLSARISQYLSATGREEPSTRNIPLPRFSLDRKINFLKEYTYPFNGYLIAHTNKLQTALDKNPKLLNKLDLDDIVFINITLRNQQLLGTSFGTNVFLDCTIDQRLIPRFLLSNALTKYNTTLQEFITNELADQQDLFELLKTLEYSNKMMQRTPTTIIEKERYVDSGKYDGTAYMNGSIDYVLEKYTESFYTKENCQDTITTINALPAHKASLVIRYLDILKKDLCALLMQEKTISITTIQSLTNHTKNIYHASKQIGYFYTMATAPAHAEITEILVKWLMRTLYYKERIIPEHTIHHEGTPGTPDIYEEQEVDGNYFPCNKLSVLIEAGTPETDPWDETIPEERIPEDNFYILEPLAKTAPALFSALMSALQDNHYTHQTELEKWLKANNLI